MGVKFELDLSSDDFDRLYAIKKQQGKSNLSGNEFAGELLTSLVRQLHPSKVEYEQE